MVAITRARRLLAVLAVLGILTGAVSAQEPPGHEPEPQAEAGDHDEAAAGHGEHKPSLFDSEFGTAIWAWITFLALLLILRKFAWPPILAGLEAREQGIVQAVESADRARAEAEATLAQYEGKLAEAKTEAQAIIDEAKSDASKVRDDIIQKAWQEAEKIKERATREMELAADRVVKDIYGQMAALSTDIAGRIINAQLDASEHRRLVDQAIQEIQETRAS